MNSIIGLDPGPERSAAVVLRGGMPVESVQDSNDALRTWLLRHDTSDGVLVVEQIASMGMAVGQEVFETCVWSGRFIESWVSRGGAWDRIRRVSVKLALCGSARAKDANVRRALIDRFGGPAATKRAKKCARCRGYGTFSPRGTRDVVLCALCGGRGRIGDDGVLAGIKGDMWAALAVAIAWEVNYPRLKSGASALVML